MKDKAINTVKAVALSAVVVLSGQPIANAANLSLAETPLFLGAAIQPNVFFVNDDSGSMDWEFMTKTHWEQAAYDPDRDRSGGALDSWDSGSLRTGLLEAYVDSSGGNRSFYYYYSIGDSVYGDYCSRAMEACNGSVPSVFDIEWRARTSGLNTVFFNPDIDYEPWAGPCDTGVDCADASFFGARSNPRVGESGYIMTRNLSTAGDGNNGPFKYEVWIDDAGYDTADGRPRRGTNINYTAGANGEVDLWDTHIRITVEANQAVIERTTYTPDMGTGALGEVTTTLGTVTSNSLCYNVLGTDAMVAAIHAEGATPNVAATGAAGCRSLPEMQTNAANWYEYSRRRSFPVKNAVSELINAQPNFRYGITVLNYPGNLFVEVPDVTVTNYSAHNTDLKERLYKFNQPAAGTPLRIALREAGRYYQDAIGRPDPILYSCQKNFTVLFTDGFWNGSDPLVGNTDGDGYSNTLADVAYKYYINDLNAGHANNVLVDAGEDDLPTYNPPEGDRTHQHMVTFTVAFGVTGTLVDANSDGDPDLDAAGAAWPATGPEKDGNWGRPWDGDPQKIDDLWHAAYNSGGTFASASTPKEVSDKLIDAITNIAARTSSAAAVALNSGTLNANSRVYQAKFDSNDWSGAIVSIPIQDGSNPATCSTEALGQLCPVEWNAASLLESRTDGSRDLFTYNFDTSAAVEFKLLASLAAAQQAALKTNPDTLVVEADAVGQQRLDYIRGDDSNEGSAAGNFRTRKKTALGTGKLGDIIHSAPAYVGAPDLFIPDNLESDSYNTFRIDNKTRTPMVYVGANDGVMHAFNAVNGSEVFGYVPGSVIGKLNLLTSQNYNKGHNYFVDGSPITFDAHHATGWKTVLAANTRGAQSVYALDITDPDNFGAGDVLWEFTDADDAEMGYIAGDVAYAKMNDDSWVVIFGNGYNNTATDGNVSATGNGAIYVVDAFTGALIKKFDTKAGMAADPLNPGSDRPNGVASVTPVDMDGDYKVDYLYAGDLFGNVWKMDVTSNNPSAWDFSHALAGGDPKAIIQVEAVDGTPQVITSGLAIKRHPQNRNQTLVMFGTGKYIEVGDSAIPAGGGQIQTFYSIWDDNTANQYKRADLLQQEILDQQSVLGSDGVTREFRVTSSAAIDPVKYQIDWTTDKGWYLDLRFGTEYGERVVVEPVIRGSRIIFVSLIPDEDPCNDGGDGWIMELNANDGSRLLSPPFDVNGDGIIDSNDILTFAGDSKTIASGVKSKEGIVAKPGILNNPKGKEEFKYFSGTSGNIDVMTESTSANDRKRQSWRQLR